MATPNDKLLGKYLVIDCTPTGGSLITLQTYSRNFTVKESAKDIDVTTRDDVLNDFEDIQAGVPSREITVSGLDSDENTPDWETLEIGDECELIWYRRGKTTGKPKRTVTARVTSKDFGSPHDGANDWTVTFKCISAIVTGTVA